MPCYMDAAMVEQGLIGAVSGSAEQTRMMNFILLHAHARQLQVRRASLSSTRAPRHSRPGALPHLHVADRTRCPCPHACPHPPRSRTTSGTAQLVWCHRKCGKVGREVRATMATAPVSPAPNACAEVAGEDEAALVSPAVGIDLERSRRIGGGVDCRGE